MAEILVRVRDKVNADFYLNCKCTKRGDVIEAKPDGWDWGVRERTSPNYRIIALPNVSLPDAQAMLAPEVDTDLNNPSRTLQRRAFRFDLDTPTLPTTLDRFLADDTRAQAKYSWNLDTQGFLNRKIAKPPIADPAIL